MIIEIRPDLFDKEPFKNLNYFIQLATYKNRYKLFVDISLAQTYPSYARLDTADIELLTAYFNSVMLTQNKSLHKPDYLISTNPQKINELNLEEAIRMFGSNVVIILENSLNDSYFVKSLIYNFDNTGDLIYQIENNWIKFENGGGCTNIENVIKSLLIPFENLPKESYKYLRCFVLLDSDRDSPNKNINYKHTNLEDFLKAHEIKYHILEKRTMENYMPLPVYNKYMPLFSVWINAFLHLTDAQKDYLNISKGFSKKNGAGVSILLRAQLDNEVQLLYSNVSETNYLTLDQGLNISNFKSEFPKEFLSNAQVNKTTLLERTRNQQNPNEFDEILLKIKELL